ncbi:VOC family protein [Trichococcus sp. K1Tr]|jgi:lactoylglutathione lyase|uniref:VOC family protein n=1 Tax=Trichococcus sp. K1Tr TaxID=3020847 RepID=UPI00232D333A|nr:VOC family protein [Trichococcus sp. K1Tr]MDB6353094.1 VOC family protein [Trichococcus sp. K1Tr]
MKIEHVAVWVGDLELMRDFYVRFFDGKANKLYRNPEKDFQSYFITFREGGARLELMKRMDVNERHPLDMLGWAHLAVSVGSKQNVDYFTDRLIKAGYTCKSQPRITGDGYYESMFLDPEKNVIEITI